jgi:hypothetical protein
VNVWVKRLRDPDFRLGPADRGMIAAELDALLAQKEAAEAALAAGRTLATNVLDFCENEAPADWDGGSLGYSIGGLHALAEDFCRAALAGSSPRKTHVCDSCLGQFAAEEMVQDGDVAFERCKSCGSSPAAEAETSPFPVSPERTTGRHEQRGDWASDPRGAASGVSDTREGDPEAQEAAEFAIADGLDDDVQEGDDRSAVVVDASCEERLRLATEALTAANDGDSIHAFYSEKLWRSLTYWKERAYAAEAQAASPVPAVAEDPKPRCTAMLTRPSPRTTCALVAGHDGPHSFAGREWTDKDKHAIPAGPGSRDTKETP